MKKKFTFVLLAVFLAISALVLYSAEKEGFKRIERRIEIRNTRGGDEMLPAGLTRLFKVADELDLTNPQLLQLRMLYQKKAEGEKENRESKKLGKKLSDPTLTEADVKKYAAEKAKALETHILAKYQIQQDLKKILTPEQFKKLEEMKARKSHKRGLPAFKSGKKGSMPFFMGGKKGRDLPFHMLHKKGMKPGECPFTKKADSKAEVKPEVSTEGTTEATTETTTEVSPVNESEAGQ